MYARPESVLVVIVCRRRDETLLLERRHPGAFWQSVTGSLRHDESASAAARRELLEETGIVGAPVSSNRIVEYPILPAWQHRYAPGTRINREHQFVLELEHAQPVAISFDEHRAYAWVSHAEALRRLSSRSNREALQRLGR